MATLGERIKEQRKLHHLNQTQLAEKLGVTLGTVSTWERDLFRPDFGSMDKMTLLFRVSYDYMLGKTDVNDFKAQNQQEVKILNWAQYYSTLDRFGMNTVESAIRCEYERCRQQQTLRPSSDFTVECYHMIYGEKIERVPDDDDAKEITDNVLKFVRLDNYGRDVVRETIRIAKSRCDAQGTREKMDPFWVSIDEKNEQEF